MNILGISCFYHDSAACLLREGEIIAAAQEERFSRKKYDSSFPTSAINWIFKNNNLKAKDLDFVVFYEKPFIKLNRILGTSLAYAPSGLRRFIQTAPSLFKQPWIAGIIKKNLGYRGKILFAEHRESHAASAFYPSPFGEAAFLIIDGVGEWETASFGIGKNNNLKITHYLRFPHSLGLLYSAFTYYIGFKVNSSEYKVMGLAPYGEPIYADLILNNLMDLKEDGSFKLNLKYFGYGFGHRRPNHGLVANRRFEELFGGPPRKPESKITQRDMDIAASIQKVTEEIMLRMVRHVHRATGQDKLCLAGGVALNCVGNGRILREGPFKEIWIQPASGDAGGALGCALLVWYKYLGNRRGADNKNDQLRGSFLGPCFSDEYIEDFLKKEGASYKRLSHFDIPQIVSDLIMQGNVIGWFQGALEFGPRALGARSIIADARRAEMQSRINSKIKYRESFRPLAPTVLRKYASEWFELDKESPYMLLAAPVKENKRLKLEAESIAPGGLDRIKEKRSMIPAVTHVDYSARIQTIKREDHPLYYDMIEAFYKKTGCPMIINTSFNVRGEPLACTPQDAYKCFIRTETDYLVIGSFLLDKKEQKFFAKDIKWQDELELD